MRLWLVAKILLHPLRFAQERIDAWVLARVKRQPGPIPVSRYRVYILPTRFGYGFGFMTLVMLMGAMNYSNSMGFALTFLLAGLGLVAMHQTHSNLVNVQLHAGKAAAVFAGEVSHFQIRIENPSARPRYSLSLAWPHYTVADTALNKDGKPLQGTRRRAADDEHPVTADVPVQSITPMMLSLPARERGWMPARVFSVGTDFPLGLFHAWTWAELEMMCLVYPRPAPPGRVPPGAHGGDGHTSGKQPGLDEFAGLRSYQRGDSPRSIHWKSLPKLHAPMVKQFLETIDEELWLDWNDLPDLEPEARLSQLTRWVLEADGTHRHYGLRLPDQTIEPNSGEDHRNLCLKTLALFQA
ncbi:MAG: DUF58 domain-containing protein [Pseudomonadota bacterium]